MSIRAFLDDFFDVILTSSSADEAGLSNPQYGEESEDIQYPASCADWNLLTVRERKKKLHEYENGLRRQQQNLRDAQR